MYVRSIVTLLLAGVLLDACAQPAPQAAAPPPAPLPPHLGPPRAANCSVTPFTLADGGTAEVRMTVGNDGGYCPIRLSRKNGGPYDAGLEPVPPHHGKTLIVRYNGQTSIEYLPNPGFVGQDSFVARLVVRSTPGYTTLNVSVTVLPNRHT